MGTDVSENTLPPFSRYKLGFLESRLEEPVTVTYSRVALQDDYVRTVVLTVVTLEIIN